MPTGTIPVESLKSPTDPTLPFYSFKLAIGTTPIIKDIFNEFGGYAKAIIITNNDPTNVILAINNDPSNPAETIPPSSKGEDDSWSNFISITPNAVTGAGLVELQIVKPQDAFKVPKMTSQDYQRMTML